MACWWQFSRSHERGRISSAGSSISHPGPGYAGVELCFRWVPCRGAIDPAVPLHSSEVKALFRSCDHIFFSPGDNKVCE